MTNILEKIDSYNIFNYLFPGTLFATVATLFTPYVLVQDDLFVGVFVYYFIGLVVSRVGSLLLEPFLKIIGFVKFGSYRQFLTACKTDSKIEILSEINNMYRTLISLFLLLLVLKLYAILEVYFSLATVYRFPLLLGLLFFLFLLSYKKQTKYIVTRVNAANNID